MAMEISEPLVDVLRAAASIGVVTGAGISAASGIPTYRGKGGIYDDPEEGDRTVEALSGPTLRDDPDRTWHAIKQLALAAHRATPNAGHDAIVALERRARRFVLLTQNVDGLHESAGSENIIDIHGNLRRTICQSCGVIGDEPEWTTLDGSPRCACGGVLRPDVVLFEEMLPTDKVLQLYAELVDDPPEVVIAVGTTAMFPYICEPVHATRLAGGTTVEINPEKTPLSDVVSYRLAGHADVILPALVDAL